MHQTYQVPLGLTSQFSFCGLPLRLDTYAGCAIGCSYCFARLRGGNTSNRIRVADPKAVVARFENSVKYPKQTTGVVSELIRRKTPIHFGGMSDGFQPIEKKEKVSLRILEYLASRNYPTVISTKSVLLAEPEYLDILKSTKNVVVQFSFSTTVDELSRVVEPFSYPPSRILQTIYELSKADIKTTVRWQPYIPGFSESPFDFIETIASVGVRHVGFEHLKLPLERSNNRWISIAKKLGHPIDDFYRNNKARIDGRELILPAQFKINTALMVKDELNKHGITFGAADNEFQYLSDNDCCCSGVDQFPGFENWHKYQIAYAVKKSKGHRICYSLISSEWRPKGSVNKHLNSESRLAKKRNFLALDDYIIDRWQNINSPFNPTSFYGILDSGEVDENGFRIYSWTQKAKNLLYED